MKTKLFELTQTGVNSRARHIVSLLDESIREIKHTGMELQIVYELAYGYHNEPGLPGYCVNCGVFLGGTACAMAKGVRDSNNPYKPVIGIDPYIAWGKSGQFFDAATFAELNSNVLALKLQDYLCFVVHPDESYLSLWSNPIRFALIDTNHGYEQTKTELNLLEPYIVNGGWLFIHDYDPKYGVFEAVNEWYASYTKRSITPYRSKQGTLLIKWNNQ